MVDVVEDDMSRIVLQERGKGLRNLFLVRRQSRLGRRDAACDGGQKLHQEGGPRTRRGLGQNPTRRRPVDHFPHEGQEGQPYRMGYGGHGFAVKRRHDLRAAQAPQREVGQYVVNKESLGFLYLFGGRMRADARQRQVTVQIHLRPGVIPVLRHKRAVRCEKGRIHGPAQGQAEVAQVRGKQVVHNVIGRVDVLQLTFALRLLKHGDPAQRVALTGAIQRLDATPANDSRLFHVLEQERGLFVRGTDCFRSILRLGPGRARWSAYLPGIRPSLRSCGSPRPVPWKTAFTSGRVWFVFFAMISATFT